MMPPLERIMSDLSYEDRICVDCGDYIEPPWLLLCATCKRVRYQAWEALEVSPSIRIAKNILKNPHKPIAPEPRRG